MADATRNSGQFAGTPVKTARFTVAADNDVLFTAAGDVLVLGFVNHSGVTALNIDAGVDIVTFPAQLAAAETLCATAAGAGDVTVLFVECPVETYTTQST